MTADPQEESASEEDEDRPSTPREWERRTRKRAIKIRKELSIEIPRDSPAADPRLWMGILFLLLLIVSVWKLGPMVAAGAGGCIGKVSYSPDLTD